MTILQTLLLSVIEGITEFLPISSTGHLILANRLLSVPQTEFIKTFDIFIQLGAIMAVVVLYWKKLLQSRGLTVTVLAGFAPTAVLGALLYPFIKTVLLDNPQVVAVSLITGGIILLLFEWVIQQRNLPGKTMEGISYKHALVIGTVQSLSFVPGVSRAAATIVGAMAQGFSRKTAVEFSFLLSIPTMLAASAYDLYKNSNLLSSNNLILLGIGFITSFIMAWITIKALLKYIQHHTFVPFALYRVAVGVAFLLWVK